MARDLLDISYINSLPQPLIGQALDGSNWPLYDIDVETGALRIDVCGLLEVRHISDFISFRDGYGIEHSVDGLYLDATLEERTPFILSGPLTIAPELPDHNSV